jgi:DNA-binding NarL/FixJ family response regulator
VAENTRQCLDAIANTQFDLVISTNIEVVKGQPYEIIPEIRRVLPRVPILAITGHNPEGWLDKLVERGADFAMTAPCTMEQLFERVKELMG